MLCMQAEPQSPDSMQDYYSSIIHKVYNIIHVYVVE